MNRGGNAMLDKGSKYCKGLSETTVRMFCSPAPLDVAHLPAHELGDPMIATGSDAGITLDMEKMNKLGLEEIRIG
jgi:hypothetical protein